MDERDNDLVEKIWRVFSSMKLGLILLGLIALVSGVGTVFPQMDQDAVKAQAVGPIWQSLGFTKIYCTLYFRLLLGLLCVNLIICSFQRFQGILNKTFNLQPPDSVATVPKKAHSKWTGENEALKIAVQTGLKRRGYSIKMDENDSGWSFVAFKRRLGNWGSMVSHLSFVVLVIGALLGSSLGFKGYFMASAGTSVPIKSVQVSKGAVTSDFEILINSAEDRLQTNGQRDNWYTDLSIIENGKETIRQTISVNHPFTFKGVTLYQASFAKGVHLTAEVKDQKIPVILRDAGENYFKAPNTDLYLIATSINSDPLKPIINYEIYKGSDDQPIQTGKLTMGQTIDVQGQYKITLDSNAGFTGIQVKQDPGVIIIWLGCFLLMLGLFLSFYWRSMVVLGFCEIKGASQDVLTMGALTGKTVGVVQSDFDRLIHDIKKI